MLEVILAVLLGVHLLLLDVAMAGPLVCVWLDWRRSRHADGVAGRAGLTLARWANWGLTGGMIVGVVLLGARWWLADDRYFAAVSAIPPSRLWFAAGELLFYFACMGVYLGLWNRWRRWRFVHALLAIAAATNLSIHFPALFTIIAIVSTRPELAAEPLGAEGYRQMLVDSEVLSHVVHLWLAALAVTGAAVMGLGLRLTRYEQDHLACGRLIQRGALLALVATLLQMPVGFWIAMELPEAQRRLLFGGDLLATGLFGASLLIALILMNRLAGIAVGEHEPKQIRRSIGLVCVLVILMVGTRCRTNESARASRTIGPRAAASSDARRGPPAAPHLRLSTVAFQ